MEGSIDAMFGNSIYQKGSDDVWELENREYQAESGNETENKIEE